MTDKPFIPTIQQWANRYAIENGARWMGGEMKPPTHMFEVPIEELQRRWNNYLLWKKGYLPL